MIMSYEILHDPEDNRFETTIDGFVAELAYRVKRNSVYDFYHTGVPKELEGRGVASALVKYGLDYARDNSWKINPSCPFVEKYIERHPDYQDLVAAQ